MGRVAWVVSTVLHLGVTAWGWSVLPEQDVVLKTGLRGEALQYGSRVDYVVLNVGLWLFVTALFGAVLFLVRRGRLSLLNLPHKEYWFAPERRARSYAVLRDEVAWLLTGTYLLFATLAYDMAALTLGDRTTFGMIPTVTYLVLIVLWGVRLDRRFRKGRE